MYKTITIVLLFALFVGLVVPVHADPPPGIVGDFPVTPNGFFAQPQPIVNQVAQAVTVDNQLIVTGQSAANTVYLPLVSGPCWTITPLQPVTAGAATQCVQASQYAGAQGPGSLLATVRNGLPSLLTSNLPHVAASVAITGVHIGPQSGSATSLITHISAASYMSGDAAGAVSSTDQNIVMAGRIAWVILNALQEKVSGNPVLFPVSIATLHYSEPSSASPVTTLFERCSSVLGGQLFVNGFPYDLVVNNETALGGSVWLQMLYPSCPNMMQGSFTRSGYYIRLGDFWRTLKTLPKYDTIEAQAQALIGPSTYHVSDLPMRLPNGQVQPAGATIVVVAVGTLILVCIFPEALLPAGGWWLLTGAIAGGEERR